MRPGILHLPTMGRIICGPYTPSDKAVTHYRHTGIADIFNNPLSGGKKKQSLL